MVDFVFELARSVDLKKLGQLTQARDRSLSLGLNKAGALSLRLPLGDKMAQKVYEVETCVLIKMQSPPQPTKTIWSGPVWSTTKSRPSKMLEVNCVGWLQTFEKRVTKPWWTKLTQINPQAVNGSLQYASIDAGQIALDFVHMVNVDTSGVPVYVTPGTVQTTQPRTRTYQPWTQVLNEIEALSQIEAGYDMLVDPVTRQLNVYGQLGTVMPKLGFEYKKNVTTLTTNTDASKMCNRMIAYSTAGYAIAEDQISQAAYGVFEEAISLSDVVDVGILQAYANAEVAIRSTPLAMHSFGTRQSSRDATNPVSKDPLIFRDFNIGDIGKLRAVDDLDNIVQMQRLFGATVGFQNNGSIQLSDIQTTAA